jgi:hypothetical protein
VAASTSGSAAGQEEDGPRCRGVGGSAGAGIWRTGSGRAIRRPSFSERQAVSARDRLLDLASIAVRNHSQCALLVCVRALPRPRACGLLLLPTAGGHLSPIFYTAVVYSISCPAMCAGGVYVCGGGPGLGTNRHRMAHAPGRATAAARYRTRHGGLVRMAARRVSRDATTIDTAYNHLFFKKSNSLFAVRGRCIIPWTNQSIRCDCSDVCGGSGLCWQYANICSSVHPAAHPPHKMKRDSGHSHREIEASAAR